MIRNMQQLVYRGRKYRRGLIQEQYRRSGGTTLGLFCPRAAPESKKTKFRTKSKIVFRTISRSCLPGNGRSCALPARSTQGEGFRRHSQIERPRPCSWASFARNPAKTDLRKSAKISFRWEATTRPYKTLSGQGFNRDPTEQWRASGRWRRGGSQKVLKGRGQSRGGNTP